MDFLSTLPAAGMVIAAIAICIFACYALIYRRERGVRYFLWIMVLRGIYAWAVILEWNGNGLPLKLIYRHIEQTTLVFIVPLFVFVTLDLYGKDRWLQTGRKLLMLLPFAAWVLVIWTDPWHGLAHQSVALVDGYLEAPKSLYTMIFNVLCYILLGGCYYFLFRFVRSIRPDLRKPGAWLLILGCGPAIVEVIKTFVPGMTYWLIPISVYFGMMAMGMLWIALRNKLFTIVPAARNVVMETVHEGIIIANPRGEIMDTNQLAERLFENGSEQRLIGERVEHIMTAWPQWADACIAMEARHLEIEATVQGEERAFIVNVYPFFSQRRHKQGTISIIVDITEKQNHLNEIARLNQTKDQLLTAISHDIRNPLAMQMSIVELLERDRAQFRGEHLEMIHALGEQVRNSYSTVENLLEWFRNQQTGVTLRSEPLKVLALIEEGCRVLALQLELKQIEMQIEVDGTLQVYADREALILVIRNLLSNAIKFSERGSTVQVTAGLRQDKVELVIRDYGTGMSEQQLRNVRDELRMDTTVGTQGERGTGLGLMVSRQLLRMGGGSMTLSSAPGEGTTCHVFLQTG
ncbi:PAS domain-containing protein [Paenibacillus sp. IB182496]|uniref:histidine kinase n=1 Tax=Paenibacillus sabuli TaxID=2772509 RepID=A0A927BZW2_9BACL|nr:histidine kinase N-terminal 7TM domain-containing protein [Paenibacillus sabuli]MBD2848635.1 PAS domain-containing protein [Paenibacillus sabuli]